MSAGGFLARAGHMGVGRLSASMGYGFPAIGPNASDLLGVFSAGREQRLTAVGSVPAFWTEGTVPEMSTVGGASSALATGVVLPGGLETGPEESDGRPTTGQWRRR